MNAARTGLLLAALTALFLAVGYLVGGYGGTEVAFVIALATNASAWWGSDPMVLATHGAQPVDRAPAMCFAGYRPRIKLSEQPGSKRAV